MAYRKVQKKNRAKNSWSLNEISVSIFLVPPFRIKEGKHKGRDKKDKQNSKDIWKYKIKVKSNSKCDEKLYMYLN